jgi:hypothetical protein
MGSLLPPWLRIICRLLLGSLFQLIALALLLLVRCSELRFIMAPNSHRGIESFQISSIFTGLAFMFVCLRVYTRMFIVRCPGLEDYFVTLAMVCTFSCLFRDAALTYLQICSIGLTICISIRMRTTSWNTLSYANFDLNQKWNSEWVNTLLPFHRGK